MAMVTITNISYKPLKEKIGPRDNLLVEINSAAFVSD